MANADRSAEQFRKMTETPIPKLILSLAAPTILSMLITSIYNLADTFFVGQISTSASGAVGIVSSLMAIIQALGFMLGHGSGSIISRSLGSQNTDAATRFASTSFFTALVFGGIITAAGLLTLPDFMMLLGSTETILPHACAYARYILLAAPIMMSSLVMNNILRYEGKASFAMIGLVTGGVLNIVLDPVFMFGFGLGTDGPSSGNTLSMLDQMRMLPNAQKTANHDRSLFPARTIVRAATRGGAEVLHGTNYGYLAPGMAADLTLVSTAAAHMFPVYNPFSALAYAANAADVNTVFANGQMVVRHGELTTLDLAEIRAQLVEEMKPFMAAAEKYSDII